VIVPLFSADQYANAERVADIGIGLSVSPGQPSSLRSADLVPAGPDVSRLADAVDRALTERAIADSANRVAAELAALPDPGHFVDLLPGQLPG
jgi:UDP:flavonoid glycosyltransferase YjiC (YdhE family)